MPKLNETFQAALDSKRFYKGTGLDMYRNSIEGVKDRKAASRIIQTRTRQLGCCGLNELDFTLLQTHYDWLEKESDKVFHEVVANYIRLSVPPQDHRVVIVGIPTSVGGASQYNLNFYRRLRSTLKDFGFEEVGKPYRNSNSNNTIVALVGQF